MFILSCIGFLMLYDAASGNLYPYAAKQMLYFVLFAPLMFFIGFSNIKIFFHGAYYVYGISLILLIAVSVVGHTAMGATRWINFGFFKFQPSELMKIGIVFALAKYFHTTEYTDIKRIPYLLLPALMIGLPLIVILKQPDLGTAIVLCLVSLIILYLAGVRLYLFGLGAIVAAASVPVMWKYLHGYQKKRILIFLDPEQDKLGAGYNIMQSKIAIGSGGFWGKGRLEGTQAQLEFLPEHQTDFVFSLFAEQFGFIGCVGLLFLFAIAIIKGARIGINCKNTFGKLMSFGLISIFSIHVFINIGMVMGVLPVVGLPLPFISYGGTSMATMLIAFGLLINVALNDKTNLPNNELGIF
ncbi:MAG: rod shape-determining protein RodA [Alphaproteobacteria bacterium]|nr:rod shape-determining protein RodA [Alphaproteobacteria bacterium]